MTSPKQIPVEVQLAHQFKNIIINGSHNFFQRSTTAGLAIGGSTGQKYIMDRFLLYSFHSGGDIGGTPRVPAQTTANNGRGFKAAYCDYDSSAPFSPISDTYVAVIHSVEGRDLQQIYGHICRLQFLVKSSVPGLYTVALNSGAAADAVYKHQYTIAAANVWQKVSFDFLMRFDSGTWAFDNQAGLQIRWLLRTGSDDYDASAHDTWLGSGTLHGSSTDTNTFGNNFNDNFAITEVMLTQNPNGALTPDIPFQPAGATLGEELALCQRYCEVFSPGVLYHPFSSGLALTSATAISHFKYAEKRVIPTISVSAASDFGVQDTATNHVASSVDFSNGKSLTGSRFDANVGSGLASGEAILITSATTDAKIIVDADF